MPIYPHYHPDYDVTIAWSFSQAQDMILQAEKNGQPYHDLDLPVSDEKAFWQFVEWMERTDRKYPFSVFGCTNDVHFMKIAMIAREKGFHFNT